MFHTSLCPGLSYQHGERGMDFLDELPNANSYQPWCGHCIKFAPKYEAAAKQLKEMRVDVKLAKVDCTRQARLCQDHGIRAYPTMKIFKNNQELYHDYDGPRRVSA